MLVSLLVAVLGRQRNLDLFAAAVNPAGHRGPARR
jgi:hypothetical protein